MTPRSMMSIPVAIRPEHMAYLIICDDVLGSVAMANGPLSNTDPIAFPTCIASSGFISALAIPRIPFVPNILILSPEHMIESADHLSFILSLRSFLSFIIGHTSLGSAPLSLAILTDV